MDYSALYQNLADQCLQALISTLPIVLPYVGILIVIEFAFDFFYSLLGINDNIDEFRVTTYSPDFEVDYIVDEVTDSIFW